MRHLVIAGLGLALAGPVLAESHSIASGDAALGEEKFNRQCITCHVVEDADGNILAGRKARTGPNLYGVALRTLGTYPEYKYGKSMIAAGETGLVWDEAGFVPYVQNPTKWLREALDDKRAKGKMSYKVKKEEDAINIFAFLVSIGPEIMAEEASTESN